MAPREFSIDEGVFIVEQYARNPNACDVQKKWPFDTVKPDRSTIREIIKRWKTSGTILRKTSRKRTKNVVNEENKEKVHEFLQNDCHKSTRRISLELRISHTSTWRILQELDLKPYRPTYVQQLKPDDYQKRFICLLTIALLA